MGLSPTAIVEVSTWTTNVYPPLAGSAVNAADVKAGEQAFANRTTYLRDALNGSVALSYYGSTTATAIDSFTTTSYVNATSIKVDLASVAVGDLVTADLSFVIGFSPGGGGTLGTFDVMAIQDYGGANTLLSIPGSARTIPDTTGLIPPRVTITAFFPIAVAGPCRVLLRGKVDAVGSTASAAGPAMLRVLTYTRTA